MDVIPRLIPIYYGTYQSHLRPSPISFHFIFYHTAYDDDPIVSSDSIGRKMSGSGSGGGSSSSSPTKRTHQRLPSIKTSSSSGPTPQPPQPQPQQHGSGLLTPKPPPTPPLLLTVRFSTSLPDLLLDIPHPNRTTVAALKHLIRSRLEQPNSQRRLRFIHSGKILPDTAVLGAVLKPLPPPPRDDHLQQQSDPKGKGKAVADGGSGGSGGSGSGSLSVQRVYVICSIGDLLTDAELDDERRRAEEPVVPEQPSPGPNTPVPSGLGTAGDENGVGGGGGGGDGQRGPRGFDRLLAAGFTAAEVNQLRLQFRSIQEARHTADTLPSPDALRSMEDAWMDNNNNAGVAAAMGPNTDGGEGGDGAAAAGLGDEFGLAGMLDLLLKGMFIGFVWPLGAIGWLVRDEEKIPKRMRVFVYFGFVLSLAIGTIRAIR